MNDTCIWSSPQTQPPATDNTDDRGCAGRQQRDAVAETWAVAKSAGQKTRFLHCINKLNNYLTR